MPPDCMQGTFGGLSAPYRPTSGGLTLLSPQAAYRAWLGVSLPQIICIEWGSHPALPPGCIQGMAGGLSAPNHPHSWGSHPALPRSPQAAFGGTFGGLSAPNHSIGWGGLSAPNHLHRVGVLPCSAPRLHAFGGLSAPNHPHSWGSHPALPQSPLSAPNHHHRVGGSHPALLGGSLSPKPLHRVGGSHPALLGGSLCPKSSA